MPSCGLAVLASFIVCNTAALPLQPLHMPAQRALHRALSFVCRAFPSRDGLDLMIVLPQPSAVASQSPEQVLTEGSSRFS